MELIGLLMVEHRLIEQIIQALEVELHHITKNDSAHPMFIYSAVDFFRTYADKFHHGKEEDILFVELAKKKLNNDDQRIMKELEDEHVYARKTVGDLVSATAIFSNGDETALPHLADNIRKLCELYPKHIMKEDKAFFLPCQKYFSKQERESLLEQGYAFDKRFTNEIYRDRMKALLDHR
jgi:hemerythrin-like domain-containing protein